MLKRPEDALSCWRGLFKLGHYRIFRTSGCPSFNHFRRVRYDRLARNFFASTCLVAAIVWRAL
jgi:hypothetical protein